MAHARASERANTGATRFFDLLPVLLPSPHIAKFEPVGWGRFTHISSFVSDRHKELYNDITTTVVLEGV
jgi:hypothetical protein